MFSELQTGSVNPAKLFVINVVSFESDIGCYLYQVTDSHGEKIINPQTNLPLEDCDLDDLVQTIKTICSDCYIFYNFFMGV